MTVGEGSDIDNGMDKWLHKGNPKREARDKAIAVMHGSGLSYSQITEETGVSKSRIGEILQDEELKALVDKTARETLALLPTAKQTFVELLSDDDSKVRYKVADRIFQIAGISPPHAPATVIQHIYQDTRIESQTIQLTAISGAVLGNIEPPVADDSVNIEPIDCVSQQCAIDYDNVIEQNEDNAIDTDT